MTVINATKARDSLYQLMDDAAASHEPIYITGKRNNAVLISEDDWRALQETNYLNSIRGMPERLRAAAAEPPEKRAAKLEW